MSIIEDVRLFRNFRLQDWDPLGGSDRIEIRSSVADLESARKVKKRKLVVMVLE